MRVLLVLLRGLTYASVFVGLVLVLVPSRLLRQSGIERPESVGPGEAAGIAIVVAGAALALWCVLAFAVIGRGTPAPFDAPRRLVVRGPYRFVRNPMYIGAALALAGAALFYRSLALIGFTAAFMLVTHLFAVLYEEPTLRRTFGAEYDVAAERLRADLLELVRKLAEHGLVEIVDAAD